MANNNNIVIKINGNETHVQITGTLDEETSLSSSQISETTTVVFDFQNLQNINSCGIREWINWISPLKGSQLIFKNCPKIIVDQINMIDGFLPANAEVESFYVPYYSEETGEEKLVLFTRGVEFTPKGFNLPPNINDSKGNAMELDVIESKYFRFLNRKLSAA